MELRHTVLVVDDALGNIAMLCSILEPFYRVQVATNGEKALQLVLGEEPPDLVLLDIVMPGMSGYEVCRRIKAEPARHSIPILFVTALEQQEDEEMGLALGAGDYITKPYNAPVVLARVKTHLALYDQTRELEHKVQLRTRELQKSRLEIIKCLARAAEFRDNETGNHVLRMSHYSRLIAKAAGLGDALAETLFLAAPMHDIGKIGTHDYVLLKPGKLDAQEWETMKQHVIMGAEIIGTHADELLTMARTVALSHHEKWDGTGYPLGQKGKEIPVVGQIVAIADVFDALSSSRPYKDPWPIELCVQTIVESAGAAFDPDLIPAFLKALPQMLLVQEMYAEGPGEDFDPARARRVGA